jgi:hypothetical protein
MARDDGYTVLLHHFDNVFVPTSFLDETGITFTAAGDAVQSSTKIKFGLGSAYFDGTGDSISVGSGSYPNFFFGTGDFTIDTWVYLLSPPPVNTHRTIVAYYGTSTSYWQVSLYNNAGVYEWNFTVNSNGVKIQVSAAVDGTLPGRWVHLALTREGNDFKFYQDGVQVGATVTDADTVHQVSGYLRVGLLYNGATDNWFGYIDELRISRICRWSGDFTPPSTAYAPAPADDAYTKLLLHFEGFDTGDGFLDQTTLHTVIPVSTAHLNTAQKYFGLTSAHTATNQTIDCGISSDWVIADQDFTADCWARSATLPTSGLYQKIFAHNFANGANWTGLQLRNDGGTYYLEYIHFVTSALITVSAEVTVAIDEWHHYAIAKSGYNFHLFFDGVLLTTLNTALPVSGQDSSAHLYISGNTTSSYNWNGWIDEFRWSVGIARWTADFSGSLPTTAYPSTVSFSESVTIDGLLGNESNNIDSEIPALDISFVLLVDSGANVDLHLPQPSFLSTGQGEEKLSLSGILPHIFIADLKGAGHLDADLLYPTCSFNILPGNLIDINALIKQVVTNITVSSEILGWVDTSIPRLAIVLSGSGEIIGNIAGNLSLPIGDFNLSSANPGYLSLSLPSLFFEGVLLHQGVLVINAEIPALIINIFNDIEPVIINYKTIVLNTKNNGVTEYPECEYQQLINFKKQIIASSGNNIVALGASLDNGYLIPMEFSTGTLDFNESTILFPKDIWVTLHSGKKIQLIIRADEGPDGTEYTYISENFIPELRKTRIKIGRGFRNSYYNLIIQNIDGDFLDIEKIEVYSETVARRHA